MVDLPISCHTGNLDQFFVVVGFERSQMPCLAAPLFDSEVRSNNVAAHSSRDFGYRIMTEQPYERIIIDGRPHWLSAEPLYEIIDAHGINMQKYVATLTTGCWRAYVGTWGIRDATLFLVHFCRVEWEKYPDAEDPDNNPMTIEMEERPIPPELRRLLFRATESTRFPIKADWFSGQLRIPYGRRIVYRRHYWSPWLERERVISVVNGAVVRDREVDIAAMYERCLQRNPQHRAPPRDDERAANTADMWIEYAAGPVLDDWWPPDCDRQALVRWSTG